jgi:MFS family permease
MELKRARYFYLFIPVFSMALLSIGNGLFNTLISLRLKLAGETIPTIGIISSIYCFGILVGAFKNSYLIMKIGHIRSYVVFSSILSVTMILAGLYENKIFWSFLRFLGGYSLAGLFIVIESWLLNISNKENRGRYLSLYVISIYGAQSIGQFFLNIGHAKSIFPFCIAAIFTIISIISLVIVPSVKSPQFEEPTTLNFKSLYKISPSGVMGCIVAGLLVASIYGLLPVVATIFGSYLNNVAFIMAITIGGGLFLPFPFGYLSDVFERRTVLLYLCIILTIISALLILLISSFGHKAVTLVWTLIFLLGGISFSLFPISMSYTSDHLESNDIIEATQGLTFFYGVGSVLGPMLTAFFMYLIGPKGFFLSVAVIAGLLSIFLKMKSIHKKVPKTEQQFISMPSTTPVAAELDPRATAPTKEKKH